MWEVVETGGPALGGAPESTGFGSSLIERTVTRHFAGEIDEQWLADGLKCRMTLSAEKLAM